MQKIKVGFFGGSFNPPINTHLEIAKKLIEAKILDKVVFVPVGDYYKKQDLELATHRYNMLKIACSELKNIEVEDMASSSKNMLYAVDIFKIIYDKYSKDIDIYFIMGSDNFNKMPTWKNYDEIISKYKYIIIEREKDSKNIDTANIMHYKINDIEDITSTCIRKKIANNEEVSKYIDTNVLKYIQNNKLYKI